MTQRLSTDCAKNYRNRTVIVKVIVENVYSVHSVYAHYEHLDTVLKS